MIFGVFLFLYFSVYLLFGTYVIKYHNYLGPFALFLTSVLVQIIVVVIKAYSHAPPADLYLPLPAKVILCIYFVCQYLSDICTIINPNSVKKKFGVLLLIFHSICNIGLFYYCSSNFAITIMSFLTYLLNLCICF